MQAHNPVPLGCVNASWVMMMSSGSSKRDAEVGGWQVSRRHLLLSLAATACGIPLTAAAAVKIEGVEIAESITAHGRRLVLNGAGLRKRGYFKSNVVALYLPEKLTTVDAIMRLDGPRRIQLHLLRDFTSATISRIFVTDFKQAATDAEFKQLINEVAEIGAIYGNIKRVENGDVVNIDWVPGTGIVTLYNDQPLNDKPINSELAYQIYLRMFIGKGVTEDLRNALLGLTRAAS